MKNSMENYHNVMTTSSMRTTQLPILKQITDFQRLARVVCAAAIRAMVIVEANTTLLASAPGIALAYLASALRAGLAVMPNAIIPKVGWQTKNSN